MVLCAVFFLWQRDFSFTLPNLLALAFFFALLTPFLLPYMHERYYFAADLLGVCFAFHFPKKWWMPFAVCVSSAYVVCHNLFQTDFLPVQLPRRADPVCAGAACALSGRAAAEGGRGRMTVVKMQERHLDTLR